MARATSLGYRLKFPADIYMGTVDGLYRSPNGGIAWDFFPTYTDIDSMSIRKVVVHPGEPSLMYVVGYNPNGADMRDKVFRSLDYGYHWDLVFADTLVTDIATSIADARFALVNASSGLQFTSDKGVTWTNVQKNLPPQGEPYRVQWIHLDAGNPRRAAVSFVSKIYVNDDLTAVEIPPSQVTGLSIGACYPSPFALGGKLDLTAEYSAPRPGTPILFRLYDILGRVVWQGEEQNPVEGYNVMTIGRDRLASLPAGMYLLTGTADGISSSRKILLFP
jgi:hypothetical protein